MHSRLSHFFALAVGLCLGAGARAQEVKEEFDLPEVERVFSINTGSGEGFLLVVKPRGREGPALIDSGRPSVLLETPGGRVVDLRLSRSADGPLATWVSGAYVEQVSTATGQRTRLEHPFGGGCVVRAIGPAGQVLAEGRKAPGAVVEFAVLSRDAPPRFVTVPAGPHDEVGFDAAGDALHFKVAKARWRVDLARGSMTEILFRPTLVEVLTSAERLDFSDSKAEKTEVLALREYRQGEPDLWRAADAAGPFGKVGESLVYVAATNGRLSLKRVSFPGGIEAWQASQVRARDEAREAAAQNARTRRETDRANREQEEREAFERLVDAGWKEAELLEGRRKREEELAAQAYFAREVAPRLEAERLAAERASKGPAAVKATPAPAPVTRESGLASIRASMSVAAELTHGFTQLAFERRVEDRPGIVYLGTPGIPPSASEVLVLMAGDPATTADIGLRGAQTAWAGGPNAVYRLPADLIRNTQLFCGLAAKPGVKRVPVYVMVYWR